jgi:hypothetical protein
MEIHTNCEVNITTTERGNDAVGVNEEDVSCAVHISAEGSVVSSRKSRRKQIKNVFRKLRRRLRRSKHFSSHHGSATGPDPDYESLTEPVHQRGSEWPSWEVLLNTPDSRQHTAVARLRRPSLPAKLTSFRELGCPPPRRKIPIFSTLSRHLLCDGEEDVARYAQYHASQAGGSRAGKPFAKPKWLSKAKRGVKKAFSRK